MFKKRIFDFKVTSDLLKEKKFWLFFLIQAGLWFGFYFWQGRLVIDKTLEASGFSAQISTHILIALLLGGTYFILQILTAFFLPKIVFWQAALIILSDYISGLGFCLSVVWFLFKNFPSQKLWYKFLLISLGLLFSLLVLLFLKTLNLFGSDLIFQKTIISRL
jgi:hypothetical protein